MSSGAEDRSPRKVRRQQAQAETHGHGLPVVEARVRRPLRVLDVCLVPVRRVAARGRECRGDGEARATGGEERCGGHDLLRVRRCE